MRSTSDLDLIPGLREKIKFDISKHQKSGSNAENDIMERMYRYTHIFAKISANSAECRKFSAKSDDQMYRLYFKMKIFGETRISIFNN